MTTYYSAPEPVSPGRSENAGSGVKRAFGALEAFKSRFAAKRGLDPRRLTFAPDLTARYANAPGDYAVLAVKCEDVRALFGRLKEISRGARVSCSISEDELFTPCAKAFFLLDGAEGGDFPCAGETRVMWLLVLCAAHPSEKLRCQAASAALELRSSGRCGAFCRDCAEIFAYLHGLKRS